MNKKELQRRGKGLLALMLAFIMMFGTSMTVLAAEYELTGGTGLTVNQELEGGDAIKFNQGTGGVRVSIDNNLVAEDFSVYQLPEGKRYKVISFNYDTNYVYNVGLKTISDTPSGDSTGGNTASPEALEAPQTETGNGGGQPHVHSFSWVTTREATETQDGLDEYKCACGVIEAQITIPASQVVVNGFYQTIRDAAPNSRITCDTKDLYTLSDKMVACLAERTDVTVEITFMYQKTPYRMTIPAGSDYSALLADEDMFYGYFYFANQIGAQIEPVS